MFILGRFFTIFQYNLFMFIPFNLQNLNRLQFFY
uniref:Uncharacterized protein n=1 Tax=Triticum urartu TaxID=4572 RepID=A0A8R7QQD2_TRIUA